MRRRLLPLLLALVLAVSGACQAPQPSQVYFSPRGGCDAALVSEMGQARRTLDCAIYCVNHPAIAQAIVAAARRGVRVRVICDKTQAAGKTSLHGQVAAAEIPVQIRRGSGSGIMHLKLAIIDRCTVVAGSFNWTMPAVERNDEILIILRDRELAVKCAGQFESLWRRP